MHRPRLLLTPPACKAVLLSLSPLPVHRVLCLALHARSSLSRDALIALSRSRREIYPFRGTRGGWLGRLHVVCAREDGTCPAPKREGGGRCARIPSVPNGRRREINSFSARSRARWRKGEASAITRWRCCCCFYACPTCIAEATRVCMGCVDQTLRHASRFFCLF